MDRGQFTFYRSFWDAVKGLPKKDRLPILEAIISYALDGEGNGTWFETALQSGVFQQLKPFLDKERREAKEGRRSERYKIWRHRVFERDNYTCAVCGRRGCRLNAHHIKSYAYYPELRYDETNGVTLCEDCHKEVHRQRRAINGVD